MVPQGQMTPNWLGNMSLKHLNPPPSNPRCKCLVQMYESAAINTYLADKFRDSNGAGSFREIQVFSLRQLRSF